MNLGSREKNADFKPNLLEEQNFFAPDKILALCMNLFYNKIPRTTLLLRTFQ
jgi:hypothetical protein